MVLRPLLSCLSLLYMCNLDLWPFSRWSTAKGSSIAQPESALLEEHLVSQSWRTLLGGHQGSLVPFPTRVAACHKITTQPGKFLPFCPFSDLDTTWHFVHFQHFQSSIASGCFCPFAAATILTKTKWISIERKLCQDTCFLSGSYKQDFTNQKKQDLRLIWRRSHD